MKKIGFLIGLLLLLNCSVDSVSSEPTFHPESMPVNNVYIQDEFTFGNTYTIMVDYYVPSTCYSFKDFFFIGEGTELTSIVLNNVIDDQLCEPYNGRLEEASFDLKIENRGPYVFKFWKGKNSLGEDNYYTVEVPVTE